MPATLEAFASEIREMLAYHDCWITELQMLYQTGQKQRGLK
jgi:hypothetical protein